MKHVKNSLCHLPQFIITYSNTCESESEVAQSCLTLRDPVEGSLPGSAVHGIFQARILRPILFLDSKVHEGLVSVLCTVFFQCLA